jgi:hypothetical protein
MSDNTPKYYLRKWTVSAIKKSGDIIMLSNSDSDPNSLRVTFDIRKLGYQAIYYGDISIWNLSEDLEQDLFLSSAEKDALRIVVSAGYKETQDVIFDGVVMQPMFDRENVTDFKTTFHCVDGPLVGSNFISLTLAKTAKQIDQIRQMAKSSHNTFKVDYITPNLNTTSLPRGKTFFGEVRDYLRGISKTNDTSWFVEDGNLNIVHPEDIPADQALKVGPNNGLIGVPQQTQDGVAFRMLLNPLIKLKKVAMNVQLDLEVIRQVKLQYGQRQTLLDQDGLYKVAGVRHIGDTRGNEWYTDVTAVNPMGLLFTLQAAAGQ